MTDITDKRLSRIIKLLTISCEMNLFISTGNAPSKEQIDEWKTRINKTGYKR